MFIDIRILACYKIFVDIDWLKSCEKEIYISFKKLLYNRFVINLFEISIKSKATKKFLIFVVNQESTIRNTKMKVLLRGRRFLGMPVLT